MNISCVITAKNAAPYIEQCVKSCIPLFSELICYEHNSADNTREILLGLLPEQSLILDNTDNYSLPQIRELLTQVSSGKYIVYQDADDYRLPVYQDLSADLLVTPYHNEHGRHFPQSGDFLVDLVNDSIHPSGVYIRKELVPNFRRRLSCEYWMLYDIYTSCNPTITYSSLVSVTHRQSTNPASLHNSQSEGIKKSRLELCETILKEQQLTAIQYNLISQVRNSYATN